MNTVNNFFACGKPPKDISPDFELMGAMIGDDKPRRVFPVIEEGESDATPFALKKRSIEERKRIIPDKWREHYDLLIGKGIPAKVAIEAATAFVLLLVEDEGD